jgi:hypothetical protein
MTESIILNSYCVKPCLTQCKLNTRLAETNLQSVGPARFERRQTQCKSVHGWFCRATKHSTCVHVDLRTNHYFLTRTTEFQKTRKMIPWFKPCSLLSQVQYLGHGLVEGHREGLVVHLHLRKGELMGLTCAAGPSEHYCMACVQP